MRQVIVRTLGAAAGIFLLAGCQGVNSYQDYHNRGYDNPCTWRAAEAGFCEQPNNFHLFQGLMRAR